MVKIMRLYSVNIQGWVCYVNAYNQVEAARKAFEKLKTFRGELIENDSRLTKSISINFISDQSEILN